MTPEPTTLQEAVPLSSGEISSATPPNGRKRTRSSDTPANPSRKKPKTLSTPTLPTFSPEITKTSTSRIISPQITQTTLAIELHEAQTAYWVEELRSRFGKTQWWDGVDILEAKLERKVMLRVKVLIKPRARGQFVDAYRAVEKYTCEAEARLELSDQALDAIAGANAVEFEMNCSSEEHGYGDQ